MLKTLIIATVLLPKLAIAEQSQPLLRRAVREEVRRDLADTGGPIEAFDCRS